MCDLGVNGAHLSFFKPNKIEDGRSKRAKIKKYMNFICGILVFSFREKKNYEQFPSGNRDHTIQKYRYNC